MKCPVDDEVLVMTERQGVEIDYCPRCRGVWLDRGELDKIIARNGAGASNAAASDPGFDNRRSEYRQDYDRNDREPHHPRRQKRESFLSDLFDF